MEPRITGLATAMGYLIQFPDALVAKKLTGTLFLEHFEDEELNFEQPLVLSGSNVLIPKERLEGGPWTLRMEWAYDGVPYTTVKTIRL
ncbi:MAG: hypothetical protein R3359_08440 [Marinirhabdus sp.]|nr:hypothetical protein [Marinirhabdus sp.]